MSLTRRLTGCVAVVSIGLTTAVGTAAVATAGAPTAPAASAAPTALHQAAESTPFPLFVSELAPDNTGVDDFEYVELFNRSDAPVDLTAAGIGLAYTYADSDDRSRDVPLSIPAGTVVPAGQAVVLWLDYTSGNVDTSVRTEQDFRDHYAAAGATASDYQLVRVSGQAGMANGGDRGIRVLGPDGASPAWSFYPAGSVAAGRTAHFQVPATGAASAVLLEAKGVPSPGVVAPEALVPPVTPDPEPSPEPTDQPTEPTEPTPGPSETPTDPPTTEPAPGNGAHLQVTELLPDSSNVGTGDGYEFVELYNASNTPVDFDDYTLNYLYPLDDLTNSQVVEWPAVPGDVVVPAGGTLVLWVKNGQNDHLTGADFNAKFGTHLVAGTDLLEIHSGGMANASPRGLEITTRTGFALNRAYYNLGGAKDPVADQGIQYAADAADAMVQRKTGVSAATPGAVSAAQKPAAPVEVPADTAAPTVEDATPAQVDPADELAIEATVTDDVQVRSVRLLLRSDVDADYQRIDLAAGLAADGSGARTAFRHAIHPADLTGKRWYEYVLVASDGTHETRTAPRRIEITGVDTAPVRLSVAEGEFVTGMTPVAAAGDTYPSPLSLTIDGTRATPVAPALEDEPVFAFEAGGVNTFFRNGVLSGGEVLNIFDDGIYEGYETIATDVPLRMVRQGDELVVSVYAGTKAAPEIDPHENNDDFQIKNLRLVLPDGRTLRPAGYDDPTRVLQMGDSAGKLDFFDARFTLPDDAFTAVSHSWDTTAAADGEHTVAATDGTDSARATVVVDNTSPVITTDAVDGTDYRGEFTLDASATDAGSGLASLTATLDGQAVTLPYATSSLVLPDGEHTFALTARDAVGNRSERTVTFTTPVENPGSEAVSPAGGTTVEGDEVELRAKVTDPSGDRLDVSFREGYRLDDEDAAVVTSSGTTRVAADTALARPGPGVRVGDPARADGATTSSDAEFPYRTYQVTIPEDAGEDYATRLTWDGSANADAKVLLYVLNTATGDWDEVDRHVTAAGATGATGPEAFTLAATVPAKDHARDGVLTVLVQHSEGFAGEDLSTRQTPVTPNHPEDTPRSSYDFTLGWESDTQYYNDSYYDRQLDIHDYFLDQREATNLQYVFHTGDIVDNHTQPHQWANADAAYSMLDDAGLPYGVLAGNHDVGHKEIDYGPYSQLFGEARYAANPWYGGSYQDNRGHYDLVTAGGIDFLMLYMGWGPGDDEIAWMNEVLARYPEREAIINLHEYMLTTGGLGPVPQRIYDEVVATNPNVKMVFSGHYHDAFTRVDAFDDDGDGVTDRSVHQILFDYQGLPEGGQSFLRLLQFDNQGRTIHARTYSPYLDRYGSDDPSLAPEHQDFVIPYAALGIEPRTKTLTSDGFTAEVLMTRSIAEFDDVESGTELSATWQRPGAGEHGWYVVTADPYGGTDSSEVYLVNFAEVTPGGDGDGGSTGGTGGAGAGGSTTDPATGAGTGGGADKGLGSRLPTTGTPAGLLVGLALLLVAGGSALVARNRRAARATASGSGDGGQ
ncbi:metallophosphoesterase [Oerskovia gallyi]|uniref:Lamin tail domain-containing protein n=1 Tax=Oerskovia gallyi TaxID=2762226 RepID=A0ABR8V5K3_9CELL|nr:metallophosphoesterase [Oerskovia gallyi]MBD8000063.1 lamin tail domain-containing protein [Oerskovia gallyi]